MAGHPIKDEGGKMRTRMVDREWWLDERNASLSFFERLVWRALHGMADREGMLMNRPARVKAEAFAYDTVSCDEIVTAVAKLASLGIVAFLEPSDGSVEKCIYVYNFKEEQHVHPHEAASKLSCNYIPGNVSKCTSASASASTSASTSTSRSCRVPAERRPGASEVRTIIDHLNAKAGTRFRAESKTTVAMIKARLAGGYTVDDCLRVIDSRCAAWLDDPKMRMYLRPETLFNATKFEGYIGGLTEGAAESWADRMQREIDQRGAK